MCPKCGKELGQDQTKCDKCGCPVNANNAQTGNLTNYGPDAQKPKTAPEGTNMLLNRAAEILFDASTGRFIYATNQDHSDISLKRHREKHFPELKDIPQVLPEGQGKKHDIFKGVEKPQTCRKKRPSVDEISKSCTDLAIDG